MGRFGFFFHNPMNILSVAIFSTFIIALVIVLVLLFFQSISLQCLRGQDHGHCGGNPRSNCHLEGISVTSYGMDMAASSSSKAFGCDGCAICLGDYCTGEGVVVLPRCKHMFHKHCITQWVPAKSSRCPVCREPVVERTVDPAVSDGHALPMNVVSNSFVLNRLGLT